jgi:hypothetical protein
MTDGRSRHGRWGCRRGLGCPSAILGSRLLWLLRFPVGVLSLPESRMRCQCSCFEVVRRLGQAIVIIWLGRSNEPFVIPGSRQYQWTWRSGRQTFPSLFVANIAIAAGGLVSRTRRCLSDGGCGAGSEVQVRSCLWYRADGGGNTKVRWTDWRVRSRYVGMNSY